LSPRSWKPLFKANIKAFIPFFVITIFFFAWKFYIYVNLTKNKFPLSFELQKISLVYFFVKNLLELDNYLLLNRKVFSSKTKLDLLFQYILPYLLAFYGILSRFSVTKNRPFCSQKKRRFLPLLKSPLISFCRPFGDKSPHLVTLVPLIVAIINL